MLSRLAESIYWMGRYLERADSNARLLKVQEINSLGLFQEVLVHPGWRPIVTINGYEAIFDSLYPEPSRAAVCDFMIVSLDNPSSLLSCVKNARENARSLLDRLPSEIWEAFNDFYWDLEEIRTKRPGEIENLQEFCNFALQHTFRILGAIHVSMPREEEYRFLELGIYLERAEQTARILDVRYHYAVRSPQDDALLSVHHWTNILRSISAYEAFLKRYQWHLTAQNVVTFLVFEPNFPRSIEFCTRQVALAVESLVPTSRKEGHPLARAVGKLWNEVRYGDAAEWLQRGLHAHLTTFQSRTFVVGDLVNRYVFAQEVDGVVGHISGDAPDEVLL